MKIKIMKAILGAAGIITVTATWVAAFAYGDAVARPEDGGRPGLYGGAETMKSRIMMDYSPGATYETSDIPAFSFFREFTGTKYVPSDFEIKIPVKRPAFYQAFTRAVRERDADTIKITDNLFSRLGGTLEPIRNPDLQIQADDIIVMALADYHNIDRQALVSHSRRLRVNHEIGHAYFKAVNYNYFNLKHDHPYIEMLSEYAAEKVAINIGLKEISDDPRFKDKQAADKALIDMFSIIRAEVVSSEHAGAVIAVCEQYNRIESPGRIVADALMGHIPRESVIAMADYRENKYRSKCMDGINNRVTHLVKSVSLTRNGYL